MSSLGELRAASAESNVANSFYMYQLTAGTISGGIVVGPMLDLTATSNQITTSFGSGTPTTLNINPSTQATTITTPAISTTTARSVLLDSGNHVIPATDYSFSGTVSGVTLSGTNIELQGGNIAFNSNEANQTVVQAETASGANLLTIPDSGGNDYEFSLCFDAGLNGVAPTYTALAFTPGSTGSTQAALNNFETYLHTTNWSGPTNATAGNIQVIAIGPLISLMIPTVSAAGISNSAVFTQATALPTRFRPSAQVTLNAIRIVNNGTQLGTGYAVLSTAGVITVAVSFGGNGYASGTGTMEFNDFRLIYYVPVA